MQLACQTKSVCHTANQEGHAVSSRSGCRQLHVGFGQKRRVLLIHAAHIHPCRRFVCRFVYTLISNTTDSDVGPDRPLLLHLWWCSTADPWQCAQMLERLGSPLGAFAAADQWPVLPPLSCRTPACQACPQGWFRRQLPYSARHPTLFPNVGAQEAHLGIKALHSMYKRSKPDVHFAIFWARSIQALQLPAR